MLASKAARHLSRVCHLVLHIVTADVGYRIEHADELFALDFAAPMQWLRSGWPSLDVSFGRGGKGTASLISLRQALLLSRVNQVPQHVLRHAGADEQI